MSERDEPLTPAEAAELCRLFAKATGETLRPPSDATPPQNLPLVWMVEFVAATSPPVHRASREASSRAYYR